MQAMQIILNLILTIIPFIVLLMVIYRQDKEIKDLRNMLLLGPEAQSNLEIIRERMNLEGRLGKYAAKKGGYQVPNSIEVERIHSDYRDQFNRQPYPPKPHTEGVFGEAKGQFHNALDDEEEYNG